MSVSGARRAEGWAARNGASSLGVLVLACALLCLIAPGAALGRSAKPLAADRLNRVKRFVVIYQENHSFDALLGGWEGVDGLANARPNRTIQVDQHGSPLTCLLQVDPELAKQPTTCNGTDAGGNPFQSHFPNQPFDIGRFVPEDADTCPDKYGSKQYGCTLDLKHSFYQARYELNDGRQNHFAVGNDISAGLTMGHWDTHALPIYQYLHGLGDPYLEGTNHPRYAIADRFFQAAIGGSFLNHQWLIAARTPTWPDANNDGTIKARGEDLHSVVDVNGMPSSYDPANKAQPSMLYRSPLEDATKVLYDGALTASCHPKEAGQDTRPEPPPDVPCGDYAINTINPPQQPTGGSKRGQLPLQRLTARTIADLLDAKGISWAWYADGWSNADGDVGEPGWTNGDEPVEGRQGTTCSDPHTAKGAMWPFCPHVAFEYHHQPFNYFAAFSRDTVEGRAERDAHLRDLAEFKGLVGKSEFKCQLPQVSFTKFMRDQDEHPGMRPFKGNQAVVELIRSIEDSACAGQTMVVYTYDEYGGAWDHVPPSGQGATPGPHDQWGPGARIPAIIISPLLRRGFVVDHTRYDTTSILATIERRFGLPSLGSRDAKVNDLSGVLAAGG